MASLSDWRWLYPGMRHVELRRRLQKLEQEAEDSKRETFRLLEAMDVRLQAAIVEMKQAILEADLNSQRSIDNLKAYMPVERLAAGFELAATRFHPVDPARQFYRGLNAVGILNWEDDWKSGERRFVSRLLEHRSDPVILDVGANVGNYARMVRSLDSNAMIHSFEPHPASFAKLSEFADGDERMVAHQLALSDEAGEIDLFDYSDKPGSEHASVHSGVIENHGGVAECHRVKCDTVDNIVSQYEISHIDLLKIDTEGHELATLKGSKRALEEHKIRLIHFEFNSMNVFSRVFMKDFFDFLSGYKFYRLLPDRAIHLSKYDPVSMEIFAYQNIVCARGDVEMEWLTAQGAFID